MPRVRVSDEPSANLAHCIVPTGLVADPLELDKEKASTVRVRRSSLALRARLQTPRPDLWAGTSLKGRPRPGKMSRVLRTIPERDPLQGGPLSAGAQFKRSRRIRHMHPRITACAPSSPFSRLQDAPRLNCPLAHPRATRQRPANGGKNRWPRRASSHR